VNAPIVHVVDDDEAMRVAVARLLRAEGYEVRTYASAGDFLLTPEQGPGCIVLDIKMPGPSGLELQEALQRYPTPLPIVFLTGGGDIASSVRAMKSGAVDFLTKPVEPTVLVGAVETALTRDRSARAQRERIGKAQARFARLTQRERSVFEHVVAGKLNKQIADQLGISERTVKMHRAQVVAKMEAGSLAELVHMADLLDHAGTARPPSASEG
jgi:FixJ family two-component response regulator